MAQMPQVRLVLSVVIAGIPVVESEKLLNSPPGSSKQTDASLEAMVKGGILSQIPTLSMKNLPEVRSRMESAGKAYLDQLAQEKEAAEAAHAQESPSPR